MEFEPRNHLERLLLQAVNDPAARPDFFRAFLDAKIFVIGRAGESIRTIDFEGRQVIPIFSAAERIAAFAPDETYVGLLASQLFEAVGVHEVLLNPGTVGKHFTAQEIAGLLDGSAFAPHSTWVSKKAEQILIGEPDEVPHALVDALKRYFAERPQVQRAYLAMIEIPSRGEPPNLLVAVDVDGDLAPISGEAGWIVTNVMPPGQFVDFARTSIVPGYFDGVVPFYSRG